MRNQMIKQRQVAAHKAIEPIFIYPHHKTEQVLEKVNLDTPNTTVRLQINHKKWLKNDPFKPKIINDMQHKILNDFMKDRGKQKQQISINNVIKYQKRPQKPIIIGHLDIKQREKTVSNVQNTLQKGSQQHGKNDQNSQFSKRRLNMRHFERQSNEALLKNIEFLRMNEKKYITSIEDYQIDDYRNDSPVYMQTLDDYACQTQNQRFEDYKDNTTKNIMNLKQKIKVRQSKKNIYRILKNKNDNINKIKLKNRNKQKDTSNIQVKHMNHIQLLRLHCPEVKHHHQSYNIRSNNFRSLTKTYHSTIRDFVELEKHKSLGKGKPPLQLRSTKCQFLAHQNEEENRFSKRKGIQIYAQIVSRMKEEGSTQVLIKTKQMPPIRNMFRELTPWRLDQ